MKYTDIPQLRKQAEEAPKTSYDLRPFLWPAAGLTAGTAASLIPGYSYGKPLMYDAIASGWLPVLGTGAWAIHKNYKDMKKLDAASNDQLAAAENAADNTARAMQKRYNQWRISQGMEPIEYHDPEDWRYNQANPNDLVQRQTEAATNMARVMHGPLKPVMTPSDKVVLHTSGKGDYVDSTVTPKYTDPVNANTQAKTAALSDPSDLFLATSRSLNNFYKMTPEQQEAYNNAMNSRPYSVRQDYWRHLGLNQAAANAGWGKRQQDRADADAAIRYRDSAAYWWNQRNRNSRGSQNPRVTKAIGDMNNRVSAINNGTYKDGKGWGSITAGGKTQSYGTKPEEPTVYGSFALNRHKSPTPQGYGTKGPDGKMVWHEIA